MKRFLMGTLLLLVFAVPLHAQEGRYVAVTSEKDAAIQNNDTAAARTVALMMATRDAIEKAYGTYIDVKQLPEGRQIVAKAATGLQYKILAEQQRGNRYWVKIQANVLVPAEYAGSAPDEREMMGEEMKNFVQKYPQGEINWGEGFVIAHGKGTITNPKDPNAEAKAARAAELDAKAHLLEIINDVPVDDSMRAGEEKQMSFAMEGFVQGAQTAAQSKSGTTVSVTVQAPIRGVKGLTMTMMGYYTPQPPAVAEPVKPGPKATVQAEAFTGIVIDARKIPANPAVFPKIKDSKKREVYSVGAVNKEDLAKRGMASYAVVARDVELSRLFPYALVIPVAYMPDDQSAPKQKRRQGYKPLVVTAAETEGKLKANLIISEEDAEKLKAIDDKTGALKQCRVVVVVSSEVGGLEGLLRLR